MDETGVGKPENPVSNSYEISPDPPEKTSENFHGLVELLVDIESIPLNSYSTTQLELIPDKSNSNDRLTGESKTFTPNRDAILPSSKDKISVDRRAFEREKIGSESRISSEIIRQRSTVPQESELSTLHQLIIELEGKLANLENQIYQPTELIDPLLPLIAELLKHQNEVSRDSLLAAIVPIIDRAIRQRSQQDAAAMGEALADVLPGAISQEIQKCPEQIAKAIAPEIALAIEEQIKLDREAIAHTLGPQMGEAIKTQIKLEQNAMVDALYPVIGNTISKYMVEMVKTINEKVETALSFNGIKRKIQARLEGISEAELILQESLEFQVKAVFLIHKNSGLVIREFQQASESKLETEMLGGMLTAIRSFVNDCVTKPGESSELHTIECDAFRIILEVAGYCYLAAVVQGEPSKKFIEHLRQTLSRIVLDDDDKAIAAFNGDPKTIPDSVQPLLEKLATRAQKRQKNNLPIGIILLLLIPILGLGFIQYRHHIARTIESKTANALDANPELSVYRIVPEVQRGKLNLSGRVPNQYLRSQAGKIASTAAPNWQIDNQIVAVKVPPDPVLTAGEVERLTWLFNQTKGVAITTDSEYGKNRVNVTGIVPDMAVAEQITQAFQQIPGIDSVSNTVQIRPILETRLYFESNSTQFSGTDAIGKIKAIQQFLDLNPRAHLKIIGHTDDRGQKPQNQQLGIKRALVVKQALMTLQINPARLHISSSDKLPPEMTAEQPLWLSRCVRFEVFIPQ